MSKVDFSLIRGNNQIAEFKTIADHPAMVSLSGAINDHLTDTRTASGSISAGNIVTLNNNETVSFIQLGEDFYGISQNDANDGEDCIVGRFLFMDSNQSGLVINTHYYVDDGDGSLVTYSLSGTLPYVGKAISDTEIIIKG